jgi:hypothetical protein
MLGDRMLEIIEFNKVLGSGGWYLFNDLKRNYKHDFSIEIDDWTEDFDFPQDLDTWEESRAAWLIKQNKKSPEPNET